jgi:DNA polymerase elongation subunit (family B)
MSYDNQLIFGKSNITKVVSVEPFEDKLVVFREDDVTGKISYQEIPNKYWFITSERISQKQKELSGDQFYKYLAEFDTLEEQRKVRGIVKSNKIEHWDIFSPKEASMLYHGITYFKDLHPKDVSVLFWDIETTGLTHDDKSKVLLISNTFRKGSRIVKKLFAYDEYKNQKQMIDAWCSWVREMDPTLFCGHNIYGFDLPYLRFVSKQNRTYLKLGRDDSNVKFDPYTSSYRLDGTQSLDYFNAHIFGREIVDTMFLARKYDFSKKYESYALKAIIEHEGLVKKDRQFYDAGEIRHNYMKPDEWLKIKAYAIDDADDAMSLFDLMIPSFFYFGQSVSKPFQTMINSATGSQINNIMVRSYFQIGHSIAKADDPYYFQGAISFGVPKVYKNCFKVDVASLYPSLIRQYEIYNPKKDPSKHFLQMVEYFTIERLKNKKLAKETGKQYYTDLQESQKIGINSCYGALGAPGLNYNFIPGADEVTRRGREVLEKATMYATSKTVDYWKGFCE